jgi:hypothetical protein
MVADVLVIAVALTALITGVEAGVDPPERSSSAGAAQGAGAVPTEQVTFEAVADVLSNKAIST